MFRVLFFTLIITLSSNCQAQAQPDENGSKTETPVQTEEPKQKTAPVANEGKDAETQAKQDEKKPLTPEEKLLFNGPFYDAAPEGLYRLTRHPNRNVRIQALTHLFKFYEDDPKLIGFYVNLLNDKSLKVRVNAFAVIGDFYNRYSSSGREIIKPPREFLKPVIDAVSDPEFDIRKHGAQIVGYYHDEPEARKTIPALVKLAPNFDDTGWGATRSLGLFGAEAELIKVYEVVEHTKIDVAMALATVNPASDKVLEILEKEIDKEGIQEFEYRKLLEAFGYLRPSRQVCFDRLKKAMESEDEFTREQAVNAMGMISPKFYESAIPLLEKIANDPDSSEKWEAKNALEKMKSPKK